MSRHLPDPSSDTPSEPTSTATFSSPELLSEILKVCRLYYEQDLKGREIAKKLGWSEAKVSKLLDLGRRKKIVRTSVHPPLHMGISEHLETFLRARKTAVRSVIVTPPGSSSAGQAAARYFEGRAPTGSTVVLDGGRTVKDFVQSLTPGLLKNLTIVPICADPPSYEVSAYELMTRMALKLPDFVRCAKLPHHRGKVLDAVHRSVRAQAKLANFVLLGLGPWESGFTALDFVRHLGLDPDEVKRNYRQIACMCGYLALDADGRHVEVPVIDERMPRALSFHDLQALVRSRRCEVILIAASREKLKPVQIAVSAGLCTTLVLDEELGDALEKIWGA